MKEQATANDASLENITRLSLEFGRLLMESGARARTVDEIVIPVAHALGAEHVELRIGYASLAITVLAAEHGITRMCKVGPLGVNQRLNHAVTDLAQAIQRGTVSAAVASARLADLARNTPRYPGWLVDGAVGGACASFGLLLGIDWLAVGPVFLAAAVAQGIRRNLLSRHTNVFMATSIVALVASALSGLGTQLLGSPTVNTSMIASVLLLVPGVPLLNAQHDILDGRPTLGSARAVWVIFILVFMTAGIWLGQMLLGHGRLVATAHPIEVALPHGLAYMIHQALCGGLAAIGFGVLFNMRPPTLLYCGLLGALALAVRTLLLGWGATLEGASFAAALVVGGGVQFLQLRFGISHNNLAVAGCIPMIPGSYAAKAILGLYTLTVPSAPNLDQTLIISVQNLLRVMFTIAALGTGIAIPFMLPGAGRKK